jgi:hypothetical protein
LKARANFGKASQHGTYFSFLSLMFDLNTAAAPSRLTAGSFDHEAIFLQVNYNVPGCQHERHSQNRLNQPPNAKPQKTVNPNNRRQCKRSPFDPR